MRITESDENSLDDYLAKFLVYIQSRDVNQHYKQTTSYKPGSGAIELKSGILLPEMSESLLVLDKEYDAFLFNITYKFFKQMLDNINSPLFGFAERSLYEFITLWLFLGFHGAVPQELKDRIRTLLFAGHYKYFADKNNELANYLKQRGSFLNNSDNKYLLKPYSSKEYFDRLWKIAVEIKKGFGPEKFEAVLTQNADYNSINSHQSMRVHANPLSLNEALSNSKVRERRKLLLSLFAAQITDYLAPMDSEAAELLKQHGVIREKIKPVV